MSESELKKLTVDRSRQNDKMVESAKRVHHDIVSNIEDEEECADNLSSFVKAASTLHTKEHCRQSGNECNKYIDAFNLLCPMMRTHSLSTIDT
jgi:hypothetical protein